eukprot:RCo036766
MPAHFALAVPTLLLLLLVPLIHGAVLQAATAPHDRTCEIFSNLSCGLSPFNSFVPSYSDCCTSCQQEAFCQSFTFLPRTNGSLGTCWLNWGQCSSSAAPGYYGGKIWTFPRGSMPMRKDDAHGSL